MSTVAEAAAPGPGRAARPMRALLVTSALALGQFLGQLAGCAYPVSGMPVGGTADELTQRAGPPTGRYQRDGQTRWEYATGPMGKHTWMVDLDATGKVQQVRQVLTEAEFAKVQPGQRSDDLLWMLGRPSETQAIMRGATLWEYRYFVNACFWFVVTVEPDGTVRDSGYTPDPRCEAGDRQRGGGLGSS